MATIMETHRTAVKGMRPSARIMVRLEANWALSYQIIDEDAGEELSGRKVSPTAAWREAEDLLGGG